MVAANRLDIPMPSTKPPVISYWGSVWKGKVDPFKPAAMVIEALWDNKIMVQ
jgi:hypothetical protein